MSSAAARALTMPRRMRSWSRRSSEVAISEAEAALDGRVEALSLSLVLTWRAALDLATVIPRNVSAESNVQSAKPDAEPDVAPFGQCQRRGDPGYHEARPERADHRHAEHPAREHPDAVQQQPRWRHDAEIPHHPQVIGDRSARDKRGRRRQCEPARVRAGQRDAGAPRLPSIAASSTTTAMDAAPSHVASQRSPRWLPSAHDRGDQSDDARYHAAGARNGGKG